MDTILWILILPALALLAVCVVIVCSGGRRKRRKKQQVTLRDLSVLWTKDGRTSIHIADLAPLWREDKGQPVGPDWDAISFTNTRLADFADKHIRKASWFRSAPQHAQVAVAILSILDQEGNCESVVNVAGDVESSWDSSTYGLLRRVTLADHTLNVAEEMIKLLTTSDSFHVIPDALIAALGHDLGKLESARSYMYSLGEHPLAAGLTLAAIAEFKALPKKEEITRAIKLHHKMPEGLLGKTLKKADQAARQLELEKGVEEEKADQQASPTEARFSPAEVKETNPPTQPAITPPTAPAPPPAPPTDPAAAWRAQADIYGEETTAVTGEKKKAATGPLKMLDISAWFDAEAFLEDIKPYINRLYGRRWMAFSMSDGHVYAQAKVLEEIARKQSEKAGVMDIATLAADDPTMRQVLFTIVNHLRVEHQDVIARGLIKDQFFGGYFTITMKNGKELQGYYTPFHAEAFGSIAEMESAKKGMLKEIQSVVPRG